VGKLTIYGFGQVRGVATNLGFLQFGKVYHKMAEPSKAGTAPSQPNAEEVTRKEAMRKAGAGIDQAVYFAYGMACYVNDVCALILCQVQYSRYCR